MSSATADVLSGEPCVVGGSLCGIQLRRSTRTDIAAVGDLLRAADLTLAGLTDPSLDLWVLKDDSGAIAGTAGIEWSRTGSDVLLRSVVVTPFLRGRGLGEALARHALDRAHGEGARRAWLFSAQQGSFWQRLGFHPSSAHDLAAALSTTLQVAAFRATGQLPHKVAWQRQL